MAGQIQVDRDFPGGNIIVDRIDGDDVFWRQDQSDTEAKFWFYFHARIRGAAGRTLTFHFTNGDCLSALGPAVSLDDGQTWNWSAPLTSNSQFTYRFAPDADNVRFCVGQSYVQSNWQRFTERLHGDPYFEPSVLCRTEKGRQAELARVGRLDGAAPHRLALTCRHHCCEMMASYAIEGFIEAALADDQAGRWFRENVELLVVPFADKDGVEQGDQGKLRRPRDHNRDYLGEPIHATVAAIRRLLPEWSARRLRIALDLHCPWIRGGPTNEEIYFVGSPNAQNWGRVGRLSQILAEVQTGPLVFDPRHNLPHGQSWNNYIGPPQTFATWAQTLPGIHMGSSIELPYAVATGGPVTADSARLFGRDLAVAAIRYMQTEQLDPLGC